MPKSRDTVAAWYVLAAALCALIVAGLMPLEQREAHSASNR